MASTSATVKRRRGSTLGGHRNQSPPEQFDPLVLLHHARGDHGLHFGDREAAARQTLGGRGNPGGRPHASNPPLSSARHFAFSCAQSSAGAKARLTVPSVAAQPCRRLPSENNQPYESVRSQSRNPARYLGGR